MEHFKRGGWYLPDGESHLQQWMEAVGDWRDGRLLYQGEKYRLAMKHTQRRGVAIDIGGHVGLWSWQMAKDFDQVFAFEPMPEHRECWEQNMAYMDNVELFPFALGESEGTVHMATRTSGSSGDTGVDPSGELSGIDAELRTLDSFGIDNVDFMKLDCEGYELFALRGAEETIIRWWPTIIVEQKPETGGAQLYGIGTTEAVEFLESLGYKVAAAKQGDYVMVPA